MSVKVIPNSDAYRAGWDAIWGDGGEITDPFVDGPLEVADKPYGGHALGGFAVPVAFVEVRR